MMFSQQFYNNLKQYIITITTILISKNIRNTIHFSAFKPYTFTYKILYAKNL